MRHCIIILVLIFALGLALQIQYSHANDAPQSQTKKLAVIVPYRNRAQHLQIFAPYMHHYLKAYGHDQDQGTAKIFVVEQSKEKRFNKGVLFNHGIKIAIKEGFDYIALHDVDHLPVGSLDALKEGETPVDLYAFPADAPRHLVNCAEVHKYKPNRNPNYVGGVLVMSVEHILKINGFHNGYEGWGREDDDLYKRMKAEQLPPQRFSDCISRFVNLPHKDRDISNWYENDKLYLSFKPGDHKLNGLSTLEQHHSRVTGREQTRYFEKIYVQI